MTIGYDKIGPPRDGATYNRAVTSAVTTIDLADPNATGTPVDPRNFHGNWLLTCTVPFLVNSGGPKAADVATPDATVDTDGDEAPPLEAEKVHSYTFTRKTRYVKVVRSGSSDGVLTFWRG